MGVILKNQISSGVIVVITIAITIMANSDLGLTMCEALTNYFTCIISSNPPP